MGMTDEETGFLTRDSLRLAESPEATLLPGLFFGYAKPLTRKP
jgi:hypothetical protein